MATSYSANEPQRNLERSLVHRQWRPRMAEDHWQLSHQRWVWTQFTGGPSTFFIYDGDLLLGEIQAPVII